MIFEALNRAANRNELVLVEGGFCHWHLRRDGQLTIREIIVLPSHRRRGIATKMLAELKKVPGAKSILAKCPFDLDSNHWYHAMGFSDAGVEVTKSGRRLRLWKLLL